MYRRCVPRGEALRRSWEVRRSGFDGDLAAWDAAWAGRGLSGWEAKLPTFETGEEIATRRAIRSCLQATAEVIPGLVFGGADLTENTGMEINGPEARQSAEHPQSRQIYWGIREHAMGAVMTGMAHHGGALPVGGTFFVFSDYMRPAVRLAALSRAHVIYSWTHDSIGSRARTDRPISPSSSWLPCAPCPGSG